VPGLVRRLREHIHELVTNGSMTIQNGFNLDAIPASVRQFLHLKNVGPYTVLRLYEEGIDSLEKLQEAVKEHRIRELDGFGKRSEARLQSAVENYIRSGGAA
jgi:DNA polymerase (family 10)